MIKVKKTTKLSRERFPIYEIIETKTNNKIEEIVDVDLDIFFTFFPLAREKKTEEEKFEREIMSEPLTASWHTPQQVAEYYYKKHQKGETTEAIFDWLKNNSEERNKQLKSAQETIDEMSEDIEEAQKHLDESEHIAIDISNDQSKTFCKLKNNTKITENDLSTIFFEYFKGSNLEDINYQWNEIVSLDYVINLTELFVLNESKLITNLNRANSISKLINNLKNSYDSASNTNKRKYQRAIKEIEIKKWVLEKGVNYSQLHQAFKNNPKRIAWNYKLDNQEEIPWFGEITEIFNNKFKQNLTPVGVFSWLIGGLLGLIWIGYWFISRIKSVIKNRNSNKQNKD